MMVSFLVQTLTKRLSRPFHEGGMRLKPPDPAVATAPPAVHSALFGRI